jgi:murein DD-endopeptidase MepM/ murein hydrolase activator NlpD
VRYAKAAVKPAIRKANWAPKATSKTPPFVRVGAGDSVYGIARRYSVPPGQIIALNNLRAPYYLNKGQTLRLSRAAQRATARTVKVAATQKTAPATPLSYTVKRGDTLYGIAQRKNVSAARLIKANALKRPYALRVGQTLKLPKGAATRQAAFSPRAGTATFIWPAAGRVVSGYGVKANGLRNDGINIAAKKGSAVYAAAAGEVMYAGDQLRAFGNLVLIRHKNGYISTYGHNQTLLVRAGDQVVQGQQIATIGATGSVAEPQLHFELRRNAEAIDPMRYLGRTQMAANSR